MPAFTVVLVLGSSHNTGLFFLFVRGSRHVRRLINLTMVINRMINRRDTCRLAVSTLHRLEPMARRTNDSLVKWSTHPRSAALTISPKSEDTTVRLLGPEPL
jgi:hypothetical protein